MEKRTWESRSDATRFSDQQPASRSATFLFGSGCIVSLHELRCVRGKRISRQCYLVRFCFKILCSRSKARTQWTTGAKNGSEWSKKPFEMHAARFNLLREWNSSKEVGLFKPNIFITFYELQYRFFTHNYQQKRLLFTSSSSASSSTSSFRWRDFCVVASSG